MGIAVRIVNTEDGLEKSLALTKTRLVLAELQIMI